MSHLASVRKTFHEAVPGRIKLILATVFVFTETVLRRFACPVFMAGMFAALAWLGVFSKLYPYAHLVALAVFIALFFHALGGSFQTWKTPPSSEAKRRVEEASGLKHRPFDVFEDRPVTATNDDTRSLWALHASRAEEQVKSLRWPHLKMNLAQLDPYYLRYVLAVFLGFGLIAGWGVFGSRMIAAINPALGNQTLALAPVDAWITPPAYTHLPPMMIATPAGNRLQDAIITVPEGSVLRAHLAEKDGDAPVLKANGQNVEFSAKDGKDFDVTASLGSGDTIAIRQGWMTLGSWKIRIVPDTAPQVAFTETPSFSERKSLRIAYDANDDYGVTSVALRLTPRVTIPGIGGDPVTYPLSDAEAKQLKRVDFKDLTAEPWAGLPVDLQLVATDAVGHTSESSPMSVTLPERAFFHPVARALINERKKLLGNISDMRVRDKTANLMAGLAHQPSTFGNDPVVMMALRAGAVRLVLGHDGEAASSVKDILWQAATRIEDGMAGMAEQNLREAQHELADALDHNASAGDIQAKIDRLHQALSQYLAQLSTRMAARPPVAGDLTKLMGSRTNVLTPQDFEKMMNRMKDLSASGSLDGARQELARLQQILENLQTHPPQLNGEQQAALQLLKDLRELKQDQQKLMDETYQKSQSGSHDQNASDKNPDDKNADSGSSGAQKSESQISGNEGSLANAQSGILKRLQAISAKIKNAKPLTHSADAMQRAESALKQNKLSSATSDQGEALQALEQAEQMAEESAEQSLVMLPGSGNGSENDPFGRDGSSSFSQNADDVHVPDHMDAKHAREILNEIQRRAGDPSRSRSEHDYIERLLRNF